MRRLAGQHESRRPAAARARKQMRKSVRRIYLPYRIVTAKFARQNDSCSPPQAVPANLAFAKAVEVAHFPVRPKRSFRNPVAPPPKSIAGSVLDTVSPPSRPSILRASAPRRHEIRPERVFRHPPGQRHTTLPVNVVTRLPRQSNVPAARLEKSAAPGPHRPRIPRTLPSR